MTRSGVRPAAFTRAQVETVVGAAAQAPSILNCQPWRFSATDETIDLFAVPDRSPRAIDPTGREVFISLGASLLNLRLAVAALGREPVVQLLPDPARRTHVARVRLGGPSELSVSERPLHAAIGQRRSSRQPFTSEPLPAEAFVHLQDAAAAEGGWLDAATGSHRDVVLGVLHEADREQRANVAIVGEVVRWTRDRLDLRVGIEPDSLGPRPRGSSAAVRDLGLGGADPGRGSADFETHALLAVLLTSGDGPVDWLRSGLALERVLLAATSRGMAAGLLSHGTEVVDLRPLIRDPSSRWRFPQIVLRFGFTNTQMPPSPRLPVAEILEFTDAPT
jgi:nitroreductase